MVGQAGEAGCPMQQQVLTRNVPWDDGYLFFWLYFAHTPGTSKLGVPGVEVTRLSPSI